MNSHLLAGCRVTVMGLGRHGGGVGVSRWLADQGAEVTITDLADRNSLASSLDALHGARIARFRLGEHHLEDFQHAELIVVNPAVRPGHPLVVAAAARGVVVTSEIELFLERCSAAVVGVSGSNGKSTTATMLAGMLRAAGRRAWLGGNIGACLLDRLPLADRAGPIAPLPCSADVDATAQPSGEIRPSDVVVLELSSFQLAHLSSLAPLPRFAIVTNCTPNHLDWHGDFASYAAAKQRLVRGVGAEGAVMLGPELASNPAWTEIIAGKRLTRPAFNDPCQTGRGAMSVPGEHNRANAGCALAMAMELGVGREDGQHALAHFQPLPHRLQRVATIAGRMFYNDSKATSPAAAQAALAAIEGPIWWLGGGHAKGADFKALAQTVISRACGAAVFGASRDSLAASIRAADNGFPITIAERLDAALDWCWRQSAPGDAILLSPAAASYDQFVDYADRGRAFIAGVNRLAAETSDSATQ